MKTFDSILISQKPGDDYETHEVVRVITSYAGYYDIPIIEYPEKLNNKVLIISVGGDGTMLNAMRIATNYKSSTVLGLNTGTLGFLTEEVPSDLFAYLDYIFAGMNVVLEKRMILESSYSIDDGEPSETLLAVNEFVVTGKTINAPLITEVFINEQFVSKQLGNGVLVSSSTGSTAMSLSAGGAIVSPSTNIMQIVPLVPHTLTSRPIISTGRDSITVRAELTDRVPEIEIHADGQTLFSFNRKDGNEIELTIKKHETEVKIWRPVNWNFFNVLASKMKW